MPTKLLGIPAELRELRQFVLWKNEEKGRDGKFTKVPYSVKGNLASVSDPSTWSSFDECYAALQGHSEYDGLGFVFTENDPYTGIDLDDAEGDKTIYERQMRVYKEFDSYSEISPSGNGLHIIVKGKVPTGRRRAKIEVYSSGRFFTMTGSIYNSKPIADRTDLLSQLYQQMGGPPQTIHYTGDANETQNDQAIIESASHASNGAKFTDLLSGRWNDYYTSQSEADFAFIDIVAFYTQNRNQIARIFRASELGRRKKAARSDYVEWMINKSFDRLVPQVDIDGFRIALEEKLNANKVNAARINSVADGAGDMVGSISVHSSTIEGKLNEKSTRSNTPQNTNIHVLDSSGISSRNDSSETDALPIEEKLNNERSRSNQTNANSSIHAIDDTNTVIGSDNLRTLSNISPPPGLVGDIARFIYEASPRPVPEVAIAAAIGLMAGICGKAYNISGTGLNQYVLLLARTGTGKEAMASGIDKLVNAVAMSVPVASEFIGPSEIKSGQALVKNLSEYPSYVSIMGEFGLRLRALSSERANSAEIDLRRMLLDLYNKSGHGQVVRSTIYSDKSKNIAAISAPAFSIVAESVPESFYEILNEEMIASGLLPRFMIIEYNGIRPAMNYNAVNVQPSIMLADQVATLMANAKTIIANRRVINVEETEEASKVLRAFDKYADEKINSSDKDIIRQLWNRAHIKVLKISALIAVGRNYHSPVIDTTDVAWSRSIVENDIKQLSKKFVSGEIGRSSDETKQVSEIKRMISLFVYDPWDKIKTYCPDQRFYSAKVIPYTYFNKRLSAVAAFRNDKSGATAALKRSIQILIDCDYIREAGKKYMADTFGSVQKAYVVSNVSLLDENLTI